MDTKECRHCMQAIHTKARLCQYCHGYQSWWANQRDPRVAVIVVVVLLVILMPLGYFAFRIDAQVSGSVETPVITISNTSFRYVTASDGTRLFVLGRAHNMSQQDVARIWFRVKLLDDAGQLLDSFLLEAGGLIVPSAQAVPFRITSLVSVSEREVKRAEVSVERAKARTKWD